MGYWDDPREFAEYFEPSEAESILREYSEKMKEALIKPIIEDMNIRREENERYKKEIQEVRAKESKLNSDIKAFEREKQKIIDAECAKYRKQFMMFDNGDIVYIVGSKATTEKCQTCNGTHKVMVDVLGTSKRLECPHCDYSGNQIISREYYPEKRYVSSVIVESWSKGVQTSAYLRKKPSDSDGDKYLYYQHEGYYSKFYPTIEECQLECDKKSEDNQ